MKRYGLSIALILAMFIIVNCSSVQNMPNEISSDATSIASTVESGINTAQTILTPVAAVTATPEGVIDLTKVCIPPLGWEQLTQLVLEDGRKLVITNGFLSLFNTDGALQTTLQVPTKPETVLGELDASIEVFRCETTNIVYYNPESVK